MTYPRLLWYASFLLPTGLVAGMGPAAFAQTLDNAPLPSRAVPVVQLYASPLPVLVRPYPWQVGAPPEFFLNRRFMPQRLTVPYRGRYGLRAEELLAQIPLSHFRRVQWFSPAAFYATYGSGRLGPAGAWFIQVSGERQLLKVLRRDGYVRSH